ncbi:GntR family transcriptional regulator [Kiloniella litopenaei]|uniref:GntR family transcriptional regulator n=1 Tax=Kiloniella litopenaei TaxID=1549748 RepID=UPI003BABE7EA
MTNQKAKQIVVESLADQTYSRLTDMLLSGELADGHPVMERRLAEQLNVSRTPVREAINRLETEGMLERKGGRMLVRKVDLKEFLEVLHIRKLLECDAAKNAVGRISIQLISDLKQAMHNLLEQNSVSSTEHRATDDLFHNSIAQSCGNRLMAKTIIDLRRRTAMFDHDRLPARLIPGCQEHLDILIALENADGDAAAFAMGKHIDNVRRSILEHWGIGE